MAHFGEFVVLNPLSTGGGGGTLAMVDVPGAAATIVARAASADFDVAFVDADTVSIELPASSTAEEIQSIATQMAWIFGVPVEGELGWLTVTAEGILGMADSSDPGGAPDYVPVAGTVTFTPGLSRPIRLISSGKFLAVAGFQATFDSDGEMSYDGVKNVRIIAPQWTDLSNTTWRWTADVRPGPGQSWGPFSVNFTGAPGATVNLASLIS